MSSPCNCGNFRPDSDWSDDQCSLCWSYHHNQDLRAIWDGAKPLPEVQATAVIPASLLAPALGWPGNELRALLKELALEDPEQPHGCAPCTHWVGLMNAWGIEGCKQNRAQIVDRLRQAAQQTSWTKKLQAAGKALAKLGSRFNPLDPIGSLVDEAIRRAAAKISAV